MQERLGPESDSFFSTLESESPTSILINPAKAPGDAFENADPVPWCKAGRYLGKRPEFVFDPLFHAGCYYVMEASSMFIHHAISSLLQKEKPICVLDLCAAPGGKSAVALSCIPPGSVLVSNEVNKSRFQTLQFNIDKWGEPNVIRTCLDPGRIPWTGLFDLILVDAPCSGEGLFRKDKEARAEWSPANVTHCSARQRRILMEAQRLLAPGGYLIYSTCTYAEEENIQQVLWMAKEFSLIAKPLLVPDEWKVTTMTNGNSIGYQFYPHRVYGEGFFCAIMQKPADSPGYVATSNRSLRGYKPIVVETTFPKALTNWIKWDDSKGSLRFFESIDKEVYALQSSIDHDWLSHGLVRYPGVEIGNIKGASVPREIGLTFSPSHALALSQLLSDEMPSIELELEQAIRFLRKESVSTESGSPGWKVARYKGFALGWLKQTQAGLKNYLPTKYRIIKQQVK